jgi:hypothetical protein
VIRSVVDVGIQVDIEKRDKENDISVEVENAGRVKGKPATLGNLGPIHDRYSKVLKCMHENSSLSLEKVI